MQLPEPIGTFETRHFFPFRTPTLDTLRWGKKRHHIPILVELDVTAARGAMRAQKKLGKRLSFTSWIVKCIAQAVSQHKQMHGIRKGKRQLILFEDVDVSVIIERTIASEKLPMPYIVRRANEKSVAEIHAEIRAAQHTILESGSVQIKSPQAAWKTRLFMRLPQFFRDGLLWNPLFRNPFRIKQAMGTVSVTNLGMFAGGGMSWGIPIGIHPLLIAVGGLTKRPTMIHGQLVNHEYVGLTVVFDHAITDGAPVARFIQDLRTLIENKYGLEGSPEEHDEAPICSQVTDSEIRPNL